MYVIDIVCDVISSCHGNDKKLYDNGQLQCFWYFCRVLSANQISKCVGSEDSGCDSIFFRSENRIFLCLTLYSNISIECELSMM